MPIEIAGVTYHSAADVCRQLNLTRQTLWRWRNNQKVPVGRRYRNHQLVFTQEEVLEIREYADRLEPLGSAAAKPKSRKSASNRRRGP